MIRSLQLRLLLTTSLASSVILALLGLSIYLFMWHRLLNEFDSSLLAKARTIAAMVELNGSNISFDADLDQMPEFTSDKRPEFFEIWQGDGSVLARSPSLHAIDLPRSVSPSHAGSIPLLLPDGHKGRSITLTFIVHSEHEDEKTVTSAHPSATLVLAARPLAVNQTLDDLGWLISIACASAVALSGAVLVLIVRQTIHPINQLAAEIETLNETELSRRFELKGAPAELEPVIEKLNDLLSRLDQSFAREKAFTADVAHELRTPLAGIQTTLEVCRSRPRERQAYESAIDECQSMTHRLQAMIENLLLLARVDAGQVPIRRESVDLYHLMQECLMPMHSRIEAKNLIVESSNTGDSVARTDAEKMRIVFRNLLDNAVSYVPHGGTIHWSLNAEDANLALKITNNGSQVSEQEATQLFDRFWRGDQARTDTGTHCGLGLSLCQRLIRLLNGRITIETKMDGDFTVQIVLPKDR